MSYLQSVHWLVNSTSWIQNRASSRGKEITESL